MEYGRNDAGVASAAGMSVSGHVENPSGLQVGITEANVAPSVGFPDLRDHRWVTFCQVCLRLFYCKI